MFLFDYPELIDWQRRLEPSNYVAGQGAKYHTAGAVIFPTSTEYPRWATDGSVTVSFFIDGSSYLGDGPVELTDGVRFVERQPRTRRGKFGPVAIIDADVIHAVVQPKDNYYFNAHEVAKHKVLGVSLTPGKKSADGSYKVRVVATFEPWEPDEAA